MDLHREALVIDGHTDVPTRLWETPADLSKRRTDRHIDLPRLREGGVDGVVFALYIPASLDAAKGWEHAKELYRISTEALIPGELSRSPRRRIWRRPPGRARLPFSSAWRTAGR